MNNRYALVTQAPHQRTDALEASVKGFDSFKEAQQRINDFSTGKFTAAGKQLPVLQAELGRLKVAPPVVASSGASWRPAASGPRDESSRGVAGQWGPRRVEVKKWCAWGEFSADKEGKGANYDEAAVWVACALACASCIAVLRTPGKRVWPWVRAWAGAPRTCMRQPCPVVQMLSTLSLRKPGIH